MITREQVIEQLSRVLDGHRVRDVMIRDHNVSLTIALLPGVEHDKSKLEDVVQSEVKKLGLGEAHIRFRELTEYELSDRAGGNPQAAGRQGLDNMQARRQAEIAQEGGYSLLSEASKTKFIAVASGKGGVGKSTVTVNLAAALARQGKKVGIMDADIYGFSVPDMMGIDKRPDIVNNRVIPVERFGVKVISMGFFVEDNSPIIWRGPMLGKMLRNFFQEVEWGEIDYMLLDLPPGTGDVALDVHQMIPSSKEIIVTTPHATAAFVAARAGAMARQTNHDILGVVENMAYYACPGCGRQDYVFGRGGGAKLAEELHTEILAQIPLGAPDNHPSEPDYSPSVYKADSEVGRMYEEVASRVITACES